MGRGWRSDGERGVSPSQPFPRVEKGKSTGWPTTDPAFSRWRIHTPNDPTCPLIRRAMALARICPDRRDRVLFHPVPAIPIPAKSLPQAISVTKGSTRTAPRSRTLPHRPRYRFRAMLRVSLSFPGSRIDSQGRLAACEEPKCTVGSLDAPTLFHATCLLAG